MSASPTRVGAGDGAKPAGPGQVELICGCMFAGKTEELIRRLEAARQDGDGVAAFKHGADVRYAPDRIVSHDGAWLAASPVDSPAEVLGGVAAATVVGIDEAQFFDGALADTCAALAAAGKRVVVAGLDRTCFGEPFGPMTALRRLADSVSVLRARCAKCGAPAEYTQRLCADADPAQAHQPDPRLVGDADAYEPRCGACFQPVSRPKSTA